MKICSVEKCGRKYLAKGLCTRHYLRVYKHGTLDSLVMRGVPAVERVLAKCLRTEDGCLVYTGKLTKKGYAHIRDGKRMRFAHVIIYEHKHGPVPPGKELDHKCRRRSCVEDDHLEPVTHQENVRRGRAGHDWASRPHNQRGQFDRVAQEKGLI